MSLLRWQGASNYVERYLLLRTLGAFRIRIMGNTLCGSVVMAIANVHNPDNVIDCLYLKFLSWYTGKLRVSVDANTVLRYNVELDAPCHLRRLIRSCCCIIIILSPFSFLGFSDVMSNDENEKALKCKPSAHLI